MKLKIVFLSAALLLFISGCSSNEPSELDKIIGELSTSYLEGQGPAETTTELTKPAPFTNAVTGTVSGYFGGTFMLTDATGKIYNINASSAAIYGAEEITDGLTAIVSFTDDSSGTSSITASSVTIISDTQSENTDITTEATVSPEVSEETPEDTTVTDETAVSSDDTATDESTDETTSLN